METVIAVDDLKKTYRPKARKGVEVKALEGISSKAARSINSPIFTVFQQFRHVPFRDNLACDSAFCYSREQ